MRSPATPNERRTSRDELLGEPTPPRKATTMIARAQGTLTSLRERASGARAEASRESVAQLARRSLSRRLTPADDDRAARRRMLARQKFNARVPRIRVYLRGLLACAAVLGMIGALVGTSERRRQHFTAELDPRADLELELIGCDLALTPALPGASAPLLARAELTRDDVVSATASSVRVECAEGNRCVLELQLAPGTVLGSLRVESHSAVRTVTGGVCDFPLSSNGTELFACTSEGAVAPWCNARGGERQQTCAATPPFLPDPLLAHSPFARDTAVRSIGNGQGAAPLRLAGPLVVRGGEVDVRLSDVAADSVDIEVYAGVLALELLDAPRATLRTGRLETLAGGCQRWSGGGDVLLTTRARSVLGRYTAASGSCLAGADANVTEQCALLSACESPAAAGRARNASAAADLAPAAAAADSAEAEAEGDNGTAAAASLLLGAELGGARSVEAAAATAVCTGELVLCADGTVGGGCAGATSDAELLSLELAQGNGAVQITAGPSDEAEARVGLGEGLGLEGAASVRFDRDAAEALGLVRGWIDEFPTAPAMLVVRIDSPSGRGLGYFHFATHAPYALLDPQWISAFSGTLLAPRARWLAARAAPPTCPHARLHPVRTQDVVARVSAALREALDVQPSERLTLRALEPEASLLWGRAGADGWRGALWWLPAFGMAALPARYEYTALSGGRWTMRTIALSEDGLAIVLSVTFSLVLAAIVGAGSALGLRAARTAHKRAYWKRVNEVERLRRATASAELGGGGGGGGSGGGGGGGAGRRGGAGVGAVGGVAQGAAGAASKLLASAGRAVKGGAAGAADAAAGAAAKESTKALDKMPGLPPLLLLDIAIDNLRKSRVNSLGDFLSRCVKLDRGGRGGHGDGADSDDVGSALDSSTTGGEGSDAGGAAGGSAGLAPGAAADSDEARMHSWVELKAVRGEYELFCHARGYAEVDLSARRLNARTALFARHGLKIKAVCDASTDAYRGLKLIPRAKAAADGAKPLPGEDSLHFFLRTRCKLTGRAADVVKASELGAEYDRFCLRHKGLAKVPATRRTIVGAGAEFERLTALFVVPAPGLRLDISDPALADTRVINPAPPFWWAMDVTLVLAHALLTLLIPTPLLLVALVTDWHAGAFAPRAPPPPELALGARARPVSVHALMREPWTVPYSALEVHASTAVLLALALLTMAVGLVELLLYYSSRDLSIAPADWLRSHPPSRARALLQRALIALWGFELCALAAYVTLVLVWAILGAMVAPAVILPYAAAAGTFVGLGLSQYKALMRLQATAQEVILAKVQAHLDRMLDKSLRAVADVQKRVDAQRAALALAVAGTAGAGAAALGAKGGGAAAGAGAASGLAGAAFAAASGDPDSLFFYSAQNLGLHPAVARAVLAVAKGNRDGVAAAARELAALPALAVPPSLVDGVVELLGSSASPAAQRNALKVLATAFAERAAEGLPPAQAALVRQLLQPSLCEAIVGLAAGRPRALIKVARAKQLLPPPLLLGAELVEAVLAEDAARTLELLQRLAVERLGMPPSLPAALAYTLAGHPNAPLPADVASFCSDVLGVSPTLYSVLLAQTHRPRLLRYVLPELCELFSAAGGGLRLEPTIVEALVALAQGVSVDDVALARLYSFESVPATCARAVHELEARSLSAVSTEWLASRISGMQAFEVGAIAQLTLARVRIAPVAPASQLPGRPGAAGAAAAAGGAAASAAGGAAPRAAPVGSLGADLDELLAALMASMDQPAEAAPTVRAILVLFCAHEPKDVLRACAGLGLPPPLPRLACVARGLLRPSALASPAVREKLAALCGASVTAEWLSKKGLTAKRARQAEGTDGQRLKWLSELAAALRSEPSTAATRRTQLYGLLTMGGRFPDTFFDQLVSRTLRMSNAHAQTLRAFCALPLIPRLEPSKRAITVNMVTKALQVDESAALEALVDALATPPAQGEGWWAKADVLLARLGVSKPDIRNVHAYAQDIRRDEAALESATRSLRALGARVSVPPFFLSRLVAAADAEVRPEEVVELVHTLHRAAGSAVPLPELGPAASAAAAAGGKPPLAPPRASPPAPRYSAVSLAVTDRDSCASLPLSEPEHADTPPYSGAASTVGGAELSRPDSPIGPGSAAPPPPPPAPPEPTPPPPEAEAEGEAGGAADARGARSSGGARARVVPTETAASAAGSFTLGSAPSAWAPGSASPEEHDEPAAGAAAGAAAELAVATGVGAAADEVDRIVPVQLPPQTPPASRARLSAGGSAIQLPPVDAEPPRPRTPLSPPKRVIPPPGKPWPTAADDGAAGAAGAAAHGASDVRTVAAERAAAAAEAGEAQAAAAAAAAAATAATGAVSAASSPSASPGSELARAAASRARAGSVVEGTDVADALAAVVAGSCTGVDLLDSVVGVPPGEVSFLFSLLGRAQNAPELVRAMPTLLARAAANAPRAAPMPSSERAREALCALVSFTAGLDAPLPTSGERPSALLAALCHVPPAILQGLAAATRSDLAGCRAALQALAPALGIHSGVLEGLGSMAVGEIDQVELIAEMVGFDADLAEALCLYANLFAPGRSPTHAVPELRARQTVETLSASRPLGLLCARAGLPLHKVAGLLALACGDYAHADEVLEALGLFVHAPYVRGICAAAQCARSMRPDAPALLMVEAKELAALHGVASPFKWSLLLCLAQGNVGVFSDVAKTMGWSRRDTARAAALGLLASPLPLSLRPRRADESEWLARRDGLTAASVLARSLRVAEPAVRLLVGASRRDLDALGELAELLGRSVGETWRWIRALAGDPASDSEDVDIAHGADAAEDELDADEGAAAEAEQAAADAAAAEEEEEEEGESDDDDDDEAESAGGSGRSGSAGGSSSEPEPTPRMSSVDARGTVLEQLATALASKYPDVAGAPPSAASASRLTPGVVAAVLTLPWGLPAKEHASALARALRAGSADTHLAEREIAELAAVMSRCMPPLERLERERWRLERTLATAGVSRSAERDARERLSHSLLQRLGCRIDVAALACISEQEIVALQEAGGSCVPLAVRFALGLAKGDAGVWSLRESPGATEPVSAKFHSQPRLLHALTALCAADGDALSRAVEGEGGLAETLRLPAAPLRNLLAVCVPCEGQLEVAVSQLAHAMGVPHSHALAFVAGTSRDREQQAAMLGPMLAQLSVDDGIGLACFRAMRFRSTAWVRLGQRLVHELGDAGELSREEAQRASALVGRLGEFATGHVSLTRADVAVLAAGLLGMRGARPDDERLSELHQLLECALRLAMNRSDAMGYLHARVLRAPAEPRRAKLLGALLHTFRRGVQLEASLPTLDRALAEAGLLPPGAALLIFGGAYRFISLAADGLEALHRAGVLDAMSGGGGSAYIPGAGALLVAVARRSALKRSAWAKHEAVLRELVGRFSGGTPPPAQLVEAMAAVATLDAAKLPSVLAGALGFPLELVSELREMTDASRDFASVYPHGPPALLKCVRTALVGAAAGAASAEGEAAAGVAQVQAGAARASAGAASASAKVAAITGVSTDTQLELVKTLCTLSLPIALPAGDAADPSAVSPLLRRLVGAMQLEPAQEALLGALLAAGADPASAIEKISDCVPTLLELALQAFGSKHSPAGAASAELLTAETVGSFVELLRALLRLVHALRQMERAASADGGSRAPDGALDALETIGESFDTPPELVRGFAALAAGDLDGLADLAGRVCEFDVGKVRALLSAVQQARAKAEAAGGAVQTKSTELAASLKTPQDIFVYFDTDRSGLMDVDEFEEVVKYMGLSMSKQRVTILFARADKTNDGMLNMDEFEGAHQLLKLELTRVAMSNIGVSTVAIVGALVGLLSVVGIVFVFIFFGIAAFSGGSPFEGVINSLMPLASGAFGGGQSKVDPKEKIEQAAKTVDELLESLGVDDAQ